MSPQVLEQSEELRRQGVALAGEGRLEAAAQALEAAVAAAPDAGGCYRDLAAVCAANGDWPRAAQLYERAAACGVDDAACQCDWGRALLAAGEGEGAASRLAAAVQRWPDHARLRFQLARALVAQGRHYEAIHELEICLELDPRLVAARRLYSLELSEFGYHMAALSELLLYLEARPGDPVARVAAPSAYWQTGELDKCLAACEEAIQTGIGPANFASFRLVSLIHRYGETAQSLRSAHAAWQEKAIRLSEPGGHAVTNSDPGRRLRIGYVANQLARGPFFHFITPLLRDHNADEFELFCYHTSATMDAHSDILRGYVEHFRHVTDPNQLARLIRQDQIDVLVDLSAHYGENLPLFLDRRAPVQVTLPTEYPATTGLTSFDCTLTDRRTCLPGQESQYTERPYFLPHGYLTYNPPLAVAIPPLPAARTGAVTFGLFQRPAKVNGAVWDAAAQVLLATPGSSLLIHYSAPELDAEESGARQRFRAELEKRGVAGSRARFRGSAPLPAHLAILAEADIALDSFPYSGQTTTCECLWMGVPVVSLAGDVHVSRVSAAILHQVGLDSLATGTVDAYVARAAALAADLAALSTLRAQLRDRLQRSPMVHGEAVRGIEAAFRTLWRAHCARRNQTEADK